MENESIILDLLADAVAGQKLRTWARQHGFSPAFVSGVLNHTRKVTDRLAAAFGFVREERWTRKLKGKP